jgi:phospholipase C
VPTLNDEILRVTGGPTVNDGLMSYFGGSGSLNDRERQWLQAQGATLGPVNDMWMEFLSATPGTVNDRKLAYWTAL